MTSQSMPVGIVLERREIDHPWEPIAWNAVAVIPHAPMIDDWRVIDRGDGWTRYHAATLTLEYDRAVFLVALRVFEVGKPGAVVKIVAFDSK